ncbi:hypothetical protein HII31_02864 [Pseudocercospora fuligena]|uniref:Uncharacterized protein n=1 Tax=Pseudocercospora fuligena TaxID=685502 RepID=A0A8H6RS46_9PEZI|nr:hypothetical protein HII31_02864 [Pseudocercospora fuligena]
MVQTRELMNPQATDYWKLFEARTKAQACRLLNSKGAKYFKTISAAHAKHLHLRAQRDLLVYDKCTVEELQKFCTARNISYQVSKSRSKKQNVKVLVARLEETDESMVLEKFLDLPPELRVLVYGHYFADTFAFLQTQPQWNTYYFTREFAQPPITMTSSLLRRESLPEFYDCFPFSIKSYDFTSDWFGHHGCGNLIPRAPREVLDRVQNITFTGILNISDFEGAFWEVKIELKTGMSEVRVSDRWGHQDSRTVYRDRDPADVHQLMERRARQFVKDRQQAGESRVILRVNDTEGIAELFEPLE